MSTKKPKVVVLSGPSGVGKDTVIDELCKTYKEYRFVPTFTTRKKRVNERDGSDYYFIAKERFFELRDEGDFLESAKVYNNFYGVSKKNIQNVLDGGFNPVLRLDLQGVRTVYQILKKDAFYVFIMPTSVEDVLSRLQARGANKLGDLRTRWNSAFEEIVGYYNFPHRNLVFNRKNEAQKSAHNIAYLVAKSYKNI